MKNGRSLYKLIRIPCTRKSDFFSIHISQGFYNAHDPNLRSLNWAIAGSLSKHGAIESSIVEVWADESKPIWIPPSENSRPSTSPATFFLNQESLSRQGSGERRISRHETRRASGTLSRNETSGPQWQDSGVISRRESRLGSRPPSRRPSTRDSMIPTRRVTISSRTTIVRPGVVSYAGKNEPNRFTLGFNRESQIVSSSNGCMKSRDELLKVAMSRRTKRAYQLAEQTCRFVFNRTGLNNVGDSSRPKDPWAILTSCY